MQVERVSLRWRSGRVRTTLESADQYFEKSNGKHYCVDR